MTKFFTFAFLAILLSGIGRALASQLPTVSITTADRCDIASRDEWKESVALSIAMPDGSIAFQCRDASVRLRGHSTATKPKKPFAIKLKQKAGLLGMASHKRWVLLANFMDHSLMRNKLAFAIARQTSLEWTPDSRFVNVVLNGKPQGCYLLCEQIRVDENRVSIDEDEGFLMEIDAYYDEENRFRTACRNLPVNLKSPDNPFPKQLEAIQRFMNEAESLIYRSGNLSLLYEKYIDRRSFADWWVVHELAQNAEPNGPRSCYMYKDKDGRLKAGPVWDFDLAFINVGLDKGGDLRPSRLNRPDAIMLTGDSIYNRKALWYDRLLEDPAFHEEIKDRWKELMPRFKALAEDIDRWEKLIRESAAEDERLWHGKDPARFDIFDTFQTSAANLKKVYLYRIDSMNRLLAE